MYWILALPIATLCGCAAMGTPPARIDLAGAGQVGSASTASQRLSVGASTASASTRDDFPLDLVAGYVNRRRADRIQHGSFMELSRALWHRGKRHVWLGGRGELYWNRAEEGDMHASLLARVSVDVAGTVSSRGGGAGGKGAAMAVHGRYGVGVFLEAGASLMTDGSTAAVAVVGAAVRLPGWFAISKITPGAF